ncbi:unnamed protein product [Malus baccata var. baccata]
MTLSCQRSPTCTKLIEPSTNPLHLLWVIFTQGCFVVARTGSFEDISSLLLSEAMAVRAGLLWAIDRGYQSLIIGVDGSYSQFVNHWASCGGLQSSAQHNQ